MRVLVFLVWMTFTAAVHAQPIGDMLHLSRSGRGLLRDLRMRHERIASSSGTSATFHTSSAHCFAGNPLKDSHVPAHETRVVERDGYALEHSNRFRIPFWVAEHLVGAQLNGPGDRDKSRWKPEPDEAIPAAAKAVDADYAHTKPPYDRGHMACAENHTFTQKRMNETHFLSNAVPQDRPLNRGLWARLEKEIRAWAKHAGDIYITTGPVVSVNSPLMRNEQGAGKTGVKVPQAVYKIVVGKPDGENLRGIAFLVPNRKPASGSKLTSFVRSIDEIESKTGLNFMPNLTPAQETQLESQRGDLSIWQRD